jgi:glycogen synthase
MRQELGPTDSQLIYSPPIEKEQLYPLYANSIGVLMPSRVDNYPNVCLEAQSVGSLVVGTNQSSLEEMIVDGETGFLAAYENVNSFLTAVERLLALSQSERLAMQAKIRIVNKLRSSSEVLDGLISFYQGVAIDYASNGEKLDT